MSDSTLDLLFALCVVCSNMGIGAVAFILLSIVTAIGMALTGSSQHTIVKGDRWRMFKCKWSCVNGIRSDAFGHDYAIIRRKEQWIESRPQDAGYVVSGVGYHVRCKQCGEQYDWTGLPELSPLEQLALCAD